MHGIWLVRVHKNHSGMLSWTVECSRGSHKVVVSSVLFLKLPKVETYSKDGNLFIKAEGTLRVFDNSATITHGKKDEGQE